MIQDLLPLIQDPHHLENPELGLWHATAYVTKCVQARVPTDVRICVCECAYMHAHVRGRIFVGVCACACALLWQLKDSNAISARIEIHSFQLICDGSAIAEEAGIQLTSR